MMSLLVERLRRAGAVRLRLAGGRLTLAPTPTDLTLAAVQQRLDQLERFYARLQDAD